MGLDQIEDSVREIQNLHQFFARLFPWFGRGVQGNDGAEEARGAAGSEGDEGAGGYVDGAADEENLDVDEMGIPSDQETLMRQVEAAGVSRQEFQERAQRLSTLQAQLFGGGAGVGAETLARIAAEQEGNAEDGEGVPGPHQPRVEDGADDG